MAQSAEAQTRRIGNYAGSFVQCSDPKQWGLWNEVYLKRERRARQRWGCRGSDRDPVAGPFVMGSTIGSTQPWPLPDHSLPGIPSAGASLDGSRAASVAWAGSSGGFQATTGSRVATAEPLSARADSRRRRQQPSPFALRTPDVRPSLTRSLAAPPLRRRVGLGTLCPAGAHARHPSPARSRPDRPLCNQQMRSQATTPRSSMSRVLNQSNVERMGSSRYWTMNNMTIDYSFNHRNSAGMSMTAAARAGRDPTATSQRRDWTSRDTGRHGRERGIGPA